MSRVARVISWLGARRSTRSLRSCDEVGSGATVEGMPTIANQGRLCIGRRFHFSSVPALSHMVTAPGGILEIGDDVSIGHGAAIAVFAHVTIGSGTRIGPFIIIMDTDFHVAGDRSGQPQSEPIVIGAGVRIGSHVTVLRGSEIGDGAIVAAGSVVAGKVCQGAVVSGVPAREAVPERMAAGELAAGGVPLVVQQSLGLADVPPLAHGPAEIRQWDSLGALRLLLALEEAFGVTLSEDEVLRVKTVADLAAVVDHAVVASRSHATEVPTCSRVARVAARAPDSASARLARATRDSEF
jgi:acetyltransferase-like isoleucine patch superfamily enzyme/acyl carrier protein